VRIVLMGTGPFAVPSFQAINQARHEVCRVFTKPPVPAKSRKGPPPAPVRQWAMAAGLPIEAPPSINAPEAIERLKTLEADLLVVCDYGQILSDATLRASRLGGINLHGSLLPAYRGAAPVQRALLGGETETGVSVILMTPKLDGGPILATERTRIGDDETAGELEQRLSLLGVDLVLESLDRLEQWDGESPIGEVQSGDQATQAPRLHKREAEIDWRRSRREIDCHIRGMQPWPIAYGQLPTREGKPPARLAILEVQRVEADLGDLSPGQITGGEQLVVACGDGALEIERLRPAGKREMSGEEFMRGHQLARGTAFTPPAQTGGR
jgi:methionyl-tRNA formyltransferase